HYDSTLVIVFRMLRLPPRSPLFPYTTLFRSCCTARGPERSRRTATRATERSSLPWSRSRSRYGWPEAAVQLASSIFIDRGRRGRDAAGGGRPDGQPKGALPHQVRVLVGVAQPHGQARGAHFALDDVGELGEEGVAHVRDQQAHGLGAFRAQGAGLGVGDKVQPLGRGQ